MRTKGTIASWNEGKGYGFISPISGEKQVFIHISAFSNRSRRPEIGRMVTYSISSDKQGRPCAINATLAGDQLREYSYKSTATTPILIAIIFIGIVAASVLSEKLPPIILALYVGLSILTYVAYALDKSAAKKGV
jgi:cold shock CspA family protein